MPRAKQRKLRRGSKVSLAFGRSVVPGVIIDDHGPIGPGGVRLLRVRFDFDDGIEPLEGDVREDHLRPPLAVTG